MENFSSIREKSEQKLSIVHSTNRKGELYLNYILHPRKKLFWIREWESERKRNLSSIIVITKKLKIIISFWWVGKFFHSFKMWIFYGQIVGGVTIDYSFIFASEILKMCFSLAIRFVKRVFLLDETHIYLLISIFLLVFLFF